MFSYGTTNMVLKLWLLAIFLLILWGFIMLENNMRVNTDKIANLGMDIHKILKTIRQED